MLFLSKISLITTFTLLTAMAPLAQSQVLSLPSGENVVTLDYLRVPAPEDIDRLIEMAQNFDLVILHEWSEGKIPLLRSINPDIVILLYKNRGMALSDSVESVANYYDFDQYDFAWMHDASGNHIIWDWDHNGRQDYASPRPDESAWQDLFLDRAVEQVRSGGWDGLFIDDLWTYETAYGCSDSVEYRNSGEFQMAMVDFLAEAHARMQAEGLLLAGNIGWWQQSTPSGGRAGELYLEHLDLALQEKFLTNYGPAWNSGAGWFDEVNALVDEMRSTGNVIMCYARGDEDDLNMRLYSLGTYLCITDADGRAAFQYEDPVTGGRIPWHFDEWDMAENLGSPRSDVQWHSGYSLGYRQFTNGYVVVNPYGTARTVPDLRGLYDINGNRVPLSGAQIPAYSAGLFFYNQ